MATATWHRGNADPVCICCSWVWVPETTKMLWKWTNLKRGNGRILQETVQANLLSLFRQVRFVCVSRNLRPCSSDGLPQRKHFLGHQRFGEWRWSKDNMYVHIIRPLGIGWTTCLSITENPLVLNLFFIGFPSDLRSNAWHVATNSLHVPGCFNRNAVFFFQVPLLKWYYEWESWLLSWLLLFIGALRSIPEHRLRLAISVHYLKISWEDLGKHPLCLLASTMMLHMYLNTYTLSFCLLRCFADCFISQALWVTIPSIQSQLLTLQVPMPSGVHNWLNMLLGANKLNGTEDYGLFQVNKFCLCCMAGWKWRNEPTPRTFVLCEYDASTGLFCCHHIERFIKLSG